MSFRFFALIMLNLLIAAHVQADDGVTATEQDVIDNIVDGQSEHEAILKKIEEERQRQLALQENLNRLQNELANGQISLEEAHKESLRLREAAIAQRTLIAKQEEKMDRLVNQYDLYRRQNAAKWVFPILAGLYAADRFADNAAGDQLLWGFAGFGAMMAWEQTGYGPGRAVGSGVHYLYTKTWEW